MILEIWAYERFCFNRNLQKEKASGAPLQKAVRTLAPPLSRRLPGPALPCDPVLVHGWLRAGRCRNGGPLLPFLQRSGSSSAPVPPSLRPIPSSNPL